MNSVAPAGARRSLFCNTRGLRQPATLWRPFGPDDAQRTRHLMRDKALAAEIMPVSFFLSLDSVRRNEDANGLLDMLVPCVFGQNIVCVEHRLIDGFPHYQPVELGSGDQRVADRQQVAIRPSL